MKHTLTIKPGDTVEITCPVIEEGENNSANENYKGYGGKKNIEEEEFIIAANNNNSKSNSGTMGGKRLNTTRKAKKSGSKGPNPYMRFANKERAEILRQNPQLKSDVKAVARKLGEKWRSMSDSEKAQY